MKKRLLCALFSFLFMCTHLTPTSPAEAKEATLVSGQTAPAGDSQLSENDSEYIDGTVLVTVISPGKTSLTREGTTTFDSHISVAEAYDFGGAEPLAESDQQLSFFSDKTLYVSEVSSDTYSTQELIEKLGSKAYVVSVEPDYKHYLYDTADDPFSGEQWHLDGTGSFACESSGIAYSSAQSAAKTGDSVVAVMDTGIDYTHEDLADHMWVNPNTALLPGIYGYDFTTDTPYCMDTDGHGTHCAGTIAAVSGNRKGIRGISDAKLMALKIFEEDGSTSNSLIYSALNYIIQAQAAGVNITAVNCSWGGGSSGDTMSALVNQIGRAGTLFVFASGNDGVNHSGGVDLSCPYDLYLGSHADNRNYIIITGSSDIDDMPSAFSDYSSSDVDLFAPGETILSTYSEELYFPGIYDKKLEEELTATFLSFDAGAETPKIYTDREVGVRSVTTATAVSDPGMDYRSAPTSGSLKWTVNLSSPILREKSSYLYLDVTDQKLDTEATYYVSALFGGTDSNGIFTWDHFTRVSEGKEGSDTNRFYRAPNGRTYFKLIGLVSDGKLTGTSVYYLDDIGISRADPDTSLFGKYETMSGTSMAAPMVTGAVALLREIYPDDSAMNRRNRLLACTRQAPGVAGKCLTGGVLDLRSMNAYVPVPDAPPENADSTPKTPTSDIPTPRPVKKIKVKKVALKAPKRKLRIGKKMKLKAVATPSNATSKKVKWSSSKKKWASVTQTGVVTAKKKGKGHTVKITATATDGSRKKAAIKIRIVK